MDKQLKITKFTDANATKYATNTCEFINYTENVTNQIYFWPLRWHAKFEKL